MALGFIEWSFAVTCPWKGNAPSLGNLPHVMQNKQNGFLFCDSSGS